MIVVVVVAILASVAIPSYRQFLVRGHRADAKAQMVDIGNREQQFLLANRVYADKAALTASGYSLPATVSQYYNWDITLGAGTVPTYVIVFTPLGSQAIDGELRLDSQGKKTPADKWNK